MPTRVLAFVSLVLASAIAALAGLVLRHPGVDPALITGAASFAVLGAGASVVVYRLHGNTSGTVSFIPFLTCIVLYPAWPSVALIACAVLISEFSKKRQPIKRLFNLAQHVLAASASVYVFHALGGQSLQIDETIRPVAELSAVLAFLFVNTLSVAAVVSISERKNVFQVWYGNVKGSAANDVLAIPFIHASALVYCHFHFTGVFFVALLLYGMRQLYQTTIQLKKFNHELLEVLVHTVEMRDPYTSGHSQRVSRYSRVIAKAIGIPSVAAHRDIAGSGQGCF